VNQSQGHPTKRRASQESTMAAVAVADAVERSKSPSDQKKYRLVALSNGLTALLISTSEVENRAGGPDDHENGEEDFSDDDEDMSDEEDDDDMSEGDEDGFDGEGGHDEVPSRRAGACLTVGVGSFADPEHLPGLAHYLEHMLFMGAWLAGRCMLTLLLKDAVDADCRVIRNRNSEPQGVTSTRTRTSSRRS